MKIGVDIGGTKIKAGLVEGSKILRKIELPTEANKGREKVLQNILKAIHFVFEKNVRGIGVGCPGPLDSKKGVVLKTPNLPLKNFNIKKFLERKYKKKVILENDVACMTIAEAKYGAGKGHKNIVMIAIGTGVGGGIITDGKLYRGKGNAGEVGHTTINYDGIRSKCCNNNCLEENISARAVKRMFGENINTKEIEKMALMGNKEGKKAYQQMGKYLGIGVVNIANILDPDVIIIGGGLGKAWRLFEKEMRKTIKEREFIKTKVVRAQLKDPGIIGAASLIK